MAIGLITPMDTVRREDLTDYITNVDYKNTPLYSGLGSTMAYNTLHEWPVDVFAAAADNAQVESSDATIVDLTQPTRKTNVVQMFRKVVNVSDTERVVDVAGMKDPYAYQLKKNSVEFARDVEKALVEGTRASGASGVARRLDGTIAQITTNKTARASGTSLSETEFNDILQGIFDNGTDDVADEIHVGSYLKRAISGYTDGVTKYVKAETKRMWNTVSVYESDFGTVRIYLNRFVPSGGVLAIKPEYWKVAYLTGRKPKHIALSKTGSSTKGMLEGELTLEGLAEKTSAYRSGYFVG
jgi:hypothetical protein